MKLKKPDATWPFILTHNVAAIVPDEIYPADAKQPDDKAIGSGPYQLEKYTPNQQAVFKVNPEYTGANKGQTENFIVQYFEQASALKLAIEQGDVDVAYRSLSPTDLEALRGEEDKGVKVVDGDGTEIRYIVFNVKNKPVDNARRPQGDRPGHRPRRDRGERLQGHRHARCTRRFRPRSRARRRPSRTPSAIRIRPRPRRSSRRPASRPRSSIEGWYTPTHYGPVEVDLWNEIKRQLEASGLFKVNLDSTEWDQYKEEAFAKHTYSTYGLGWFPDYPDADNYLSPFMRDGGFFQNGYSNKDVNDALDKELGSQDSADARRGVRRRAGRARPPTCR